MEKVGWCSLRPVDIVDDKRCDLADPMFFRVVHAVLASGRVELLHLGPPCASFFQWRLALRSARLHSLTASGRCQTRPTPEWKQALASCWRPLSS